MPVMFQRLEKVLLEGSPRKASRLFAVRSRALRVGADSLDRSEEAEGSQVDAASPYGAVRECMFYQVPNQEAKRALAEARRAVERSGVIIITWLRHTVTSPIQARESEAEF